MQVMSKATKRSPSIATEYFVFFETSIAPFSNITIHKAQRDGSIQKGASFAVGDQAEYDSFNLKYLGTITKITEKTVTIVAYYGHAMAKTHRLSMEEFCWRNFKFDAAKIAAENADTMMYI